MADGFFNYTQSKGHEVYAYEFGNELGGEEGIEAMLLPNQYAEDYIKFCDLVRKYFGTAPRIAAIDGNFDATFLATFLPLLGPNYFPDMLTLHLYSLGAGSSPECGADALNPIKLDSISTLIADANATISVLAPSSDIWIGESGGAYNSGRHGVTNAFNSPFWYLDQMAIFAAGGLKSYCRQVGIRSAAFAQ
jgi:heparanase 1